MSHSPTADVQGRLEGPTRAANPPMTRYETLSPIVQGVGYLLVVVSLLATWMQLRQFSEQNRMTVHQQREGSTLGLDRVFIEYPEIRDYFYGGVDIDEKNPLYARVEAVAELHLDSFDYKLKHADNFKEYQPFMEVEEVWIRDMFRTSPILQKYVEKRKTWYSQKLRDLRDQAMREP
jgi:hypothetical protein